jgi:hypothetical protein
MNLSIIFQYFFSLSRWIIWTQTWLKYYIYNAQEANEKFE